MEINLKRLALWTMTATSVALLSSCETTGDPSTGGIFWSEKKAQDRLNERQNQLENTEQKTQATQRQSAETRRKINQL